MVSNDLEVVFNGWRVDFGWFFERAFGIFTELLTHQKLKRPDAFWNHLNIKQTPKNISTGRCWNVFLDGFVSFPKVVLMFPLCVSFFKLPGFCFELTPKTWCSCSFLQKTREI